MKLLDLGLLTALRDALLVTAAASLLGATVNATVHPEPITFIAEKGYDVMVPCPEPGGPVDALEPADPRVSAKSTLIVDARPKGELEAWRVDGAVNIPYDWLDPTPEEKIAELAKEIAASRAHHVVVYGDGGDPDTGEWLGKELSAKGIKHVCFVKGGAEALKAHRGGAAPGGQGP
jgi:hypothetical protein